MDTDIILNYIINWLKDSGPQVLLLLVVGFIIYKFSKPVIKRIIKRAVRNDPHLTPAEEERRERTLIRIINSTIKISVIIFVFLMILSEFGINIAPLIAGAGVIGLALGFGGQYLVRDIITGLFIILENQYRVGDVIEISGIAGKVEDISLRVTILRDADGTVHHVPHGEIKTVSNMAKGFSRVNIEIDVAYESDIEKVKDVIDRVGKEIAEDPEFKDKVVDAPKFLRIDSFKDSSIGIKIMGDTQPLAQWDVAGELRRRLKEEFEKEGIEIPFPHIVVKK